MDTRVKHSIELGNLTLKDKFAGQAHLSLLCSRRIFYRYVLAVVMKHC